MTSVRDCQIAHFGLQSPAATWRHINLCHQQMHLLNELHTIADYYSQMRSVDRANAEACLEMHLQYLQGPKNKPTIDRHGLLRMTSDFFRAIMSSPLFMLQQGMMGGGEGEEDEGY